MKINWQSQTKLDEVYVQTKLDMEYAFRKKVSKFLIQNQIEECCDDYKCLVFNFFVDQGYFEISPETPEPIYSNFLSFWKKLSLNEAS
ncbi:hypothetical protein PK35_11730 [Tamlana nanhaiensis]|uniref:Uncharacterized protein n=1 Tax=Neotamlana nanhaiensis TaxID=1382798 RepID=A0A0D7VZ28_9FLAO|nr:hypothetical protein [Tamlana nanhaiensis]KJD32101.1 hypothetical protein PK35_10845 [Tamlana nanhaiensis]KJD32263.1 hypothetical protein PK35_11730 [Tamlana nanhaiensis]